MAACTEVHLDQVIPFMIRSTLPAVAVLFTPGLFYQFSDKTETKCVSSRDVETELLMVSIKHFSI